MSSGFGDGTSLSGVSGEVYLVVDLPNTRQLMELSTDGEPIEEYSKEGPKLGEDLVDHNVEDAK